jgi:hypothetical protein
VFTIDTYQHVLPGMQAEAARTFEQLIAPSNSPEPPVEAPVEEPHNTVEALASNTLTRAFGGSGGGI